MYIQNRRNSSKFKGYSPLQLLNGLIGLKPAIAYFAYTQLIGNVSVVPTMAGVASMLYTRFDTSHLVCSSGVDRLEPVTT
jgi:hypothetical protein